MASAGASGRVKTMVVLEPVWVTLAPEISGFAFSVTLTRP